MIDAHREDRPLLCEDITDEELYQRSLSFRGRTRNKVRGAAAIITRWPDHWSSLKNYWTILGLLALIVMIIYNAIILFAIFPDSYSKEMVRSINQYNNVKTDPKLPEIFMHIFIRNKLEQLDNYLPYLSSLTQEFPDYRYIVFMVMNDTTEGNIDLSADQHNELALRTIISKEDFTKQTEIKNQNIIIKKQSLSNFMDNSLLSKYWRKFPHHFIPFLVRAISVWEHGGIAFNPIIVTPASPHPSYNRILRIILKSYLNREKIYPNEPKLVEKKPLIHPKKEVHNIRDIIDAIENEIESSEPIQSNLAEAETHDTVARQRKLMTVPLDILSENTKRKPNDNSFSFSKLGVDLKNNTLSELETMKTKIKQLLHLDKITHSKEVEMKSVNKTKSDNNQLSFFDVLKSEMAPIYFWNSYTSESPSKTPNKPHISTEAEERLLKELTNAGKFNNLAVIDDKTDSPTHPKVKYSNLGKPNIEQLFVDTRGNILAIGTACHAFIGSIFTNVINAHQQNLTNYLMTELSLFCKGSLNPCLVPDFHVIIL